VVQVLVSGIEEKTDITRREDREDGESTFV